ncbi:catabolite control protein A [Pediococcus inopinatus]|uniref:Catabolite control protein A n=1 Tax=Pediococcus inopinatus TaxID=114090 RepID=A0ABZ0Q2G3_9LACO|nr:catabolite control protein A [Pediococcus inopinatus]AVL00228.1 catabolite control protein A [Pediococcus inopinatus]KRN60811.1 ccpA protein [Pediococcus inopinatus]WPC17892.1 catabolite control protein A [Pediococcus inopinatus]WPC19347.1 catabolite control protein A [Pediococcus inopinatus]WPC21140.1 catabolite control protein A [Pediococcus inopinatus]
MEKQTVTIYDVAREAGVSMATVSRVVNGNQNVKPATRQRVNDVIDKLDYRPNAVARGLASKKSTTIGVIIPDVTNGYFASLARGIDDVASMYKYNIIMENSDENDQKEMMVLNTLLAKQVDGIIFMGNRVNDKLREEFSHSRTPIVFAGSVDDQESVPSVSIDYVKSTEEAVSKLIAEGNKKVAFISGSLSEPINGQYRLAGYKEALKKAGYKFDEKLIFETDYSYEAGIKLASQLKGTDISAAFVGDDRLAAGVLNGLTDQGVKVPDEFALITSNDTQVAQLVRPQLTSITQPLYDIGAVSMRLLTKLMNKEEIEEPTITLPYGLDSRQTTKK